MRRCHSRRKAHRSPGVHGCDMRRPGSPAYRSQRVFLARAVHFLVTEAGIRQFLDIGTGLPSANNTHQVAQGAAPTSRVVYVDNDPVVRARTAI